jgi:hypothetical protein
MIVACNVYCQSNEAQKMEDLGLEDPGMWLPFAFDISIIIAIKQSSDDDSHMTYKCATIFTDQGDAFVTDVPYKKMLKLWKEYMEAEEEEENDIENLTI